MATRKHETQKPKTPTTASGWNLLLSAAIRRAETRADNRTQALKTAMVKGTAESTLRRYSILSVADLDREFPV